MKSIFKNYKGSKEYLVCVDSDGCVMDTMNRKHIQCFGPMLIEEWNLEDYRDVILEEWNQLNLFSKTRGINRFKGLVAIFSIIEKYGIKIEGREDLQLWSEHTSSLSNHSLEEEIKLNPSVCLKKAISWSNKVNQAIENLPDEICIFPHVKEVLGRLSQIVDIVVVSSANKAAVEKEWDESGCSGYVSLLCGQEDGTKSICIQSLLERGYKQENIVMVGDAFGDLQAANDNGVHFYPILVGAEVDSWLELESFISNVIQHRFTIYDQEQLLNKMHKILK